MRERHWTDEELIARLYGVGPSDGHVEQCAECSGRWRDLMAARERVLQERPVVADSFWAAQRRAVMDRIEHRTHKPWMWSLTPVLSTVALVLMAIVLSRPVPVEQPVLSSSEAELFTDIYSEVHSAEPAAVTPIRGLFEAGQ